MPEIPLPPENTRGFYEPAKLRSWLQSAALKSFNTQLNKLETEHFKLKVKDVTLDPKRSSYSLKEQKDAILSRQDLTTPIRGKFELLDKRSGKIIDSKETIIASIPFITERNTAVLNGSEYIVVNQQRLKPGIYSRVKESGEAEAHVNVRQGTGMGGKIIFYPEKAIFVYLVGTTQIKLYGLLKDLGIQDSAMESAWGKEIYLKNKAAYDGTEVEKLYNKIFTY